MINWYAVSIIMLIKFDDGNQDTYPIWENIVLIKAESVSKAFKKAEKIGKDYERTKEGSVTCNGRLATEVFAGVRKLIECDDSEERPSDGTELTYSQMVISDENSFSRFVQGKSVNLLYEELPSSDR